jgi:hypothetical protein
MALRDLVMGYSKEDCPLKAYAGLTGVYATQRAARRF